jgi:hypothetical protein
MGIVSHAKLAVVGFIAVGVAVSEGDKRLNYVVTDATVTSASVDCYIKASKKELVEKDTNQRAYMDCDLAPMTAEHFGYDKTDIHKRTQLAFKFKSPVDGSQQKGEHTDEQSGNYKIGQTIKVYAHKSEPGKTRWY